MKTKVISITLGFFLFLGSCENIMHSGETEKERFLDSLVNEMTLEEKVGQLTMFTSGWTRTGPGLGKERREDVLNGRCGIIFNALTVDYNTKLQQMAVDKTRLGIPLLFGYDVVHGYKTIFPIPLAEACSWDPKMIKESARLSALEAAASGIQWTFSPVADICRDPRWGRIIEGAGEDPYLSSLIIKAKVMGYQGDSLSDPFSLAACLKHFAAYGAPQAGRDYNIVDMSERTLKENYLPPYKAAIDAGVASVMTSFNEINGIPATSNHWLLTNLLRKKWGFEGLVITDHSAVKELIPHGVATDMKHAAELAFKAGVDVDMQSAAYYEHLADLVQDGIIRESEINNSVRNVLSLKYDLGLFEDPFRYLDPLREDTLVYARRITQAAFESAKHSIVLLKNDTVEENSLLPISEGIEKIAVIGPLAENRLDLLGAWHAAGEASRVKNILEGFKDRFPGKVILHEKGCDITGQDKSGFGSALKLARQSDLVIMTVGENHVQSGEAASRSQLGLPGVQPDLIREIYRTGTPVVVIILAGRPLTIPWISENIPAVVYAWHLGTCTADALLAVLSGDYNPSGKLTVSFPRNVGQIPIYYNHKNTGRPYDPDFKYTSKYLDVPNTPLYPFGYGLSYTRYEYSNFNLDRDFLSCRDTITLRVDVSNTGSFAGYEIVQLYIRDLVASVTRPIKELKGFKKIYLDPGESKTVEFNITAHDLRFYDIDMKYRAEPGKFHVLVGPDSEELMVKEFSLIDH